ncbi:MAG TPA: type II toxin-antitoxin system HicB family antitoxin [Blastocatellia bacterium]|jgi:predicted RNase H-like HicB family nuclease|nr:type II toxin-antitoxin system HicB family antitoxin [Blastocatellia bacterium]
MNNTYTAVIQQDGDWWIGWVIEVPGANAQEKTKDELLESLKLAVKDILEVQRENALRKAAPNQQQVLISV